MNTHRSLVTAGILALALGATACSKDPTEGKAKAKVASAASSVEQPKTEGKKEVLSFTSENSSIAFVGSKVTGSHEGKFEQFMGTIELVDGKPEQGKVEVTIETGSVSIEPTKLQGHLKSDDFFAVEKFPKAKFVSTQIKRGGDENATHTVAGNLELHGEKKAISFPAVIKVDDGSVSAKAEFSINRKDFGIVYKGAPDDLIRDDVLIRLEITAPRK